MYKEKRKKYWGIIIILIASAIIYFWYFSEAPEGMVVLCFNSLEEITTKNNGKNDIILEDCRDYLVDYNKTKKTLLYMNSKGELVEQNIKTGVISTLDTFKELDESIRGSDNEYLHNIRYGLEEGEICFTSYENGFYVWQTDEKKENRIMRKYGWPDWDNTYEWKDFPIRALLNVCTSYWFNTYEWKDSDTVYILMWERGDISRNSYLSLYSWNIKSGAKEQIGYVRSFTSSEDGKKIYGIKEHWKPNGIGGIERYYDIWEIDLESGTSKKLTDTKTKWNFILECIDNKYLIYVEERGKKSKVYCLNLETGEKKCIYKTRSKVVGIVWQNELQ